ncbi:DUF262 domain-containing protein [Caenimonas sedimenti]|uniref:DUF262 domain-containing protein n=1 Tax=Caenimonas sedimenti TaxID=2596921 RepID=A0A562ZMF5_9BURK|nr:DUF262 domain-containing protein [Caenimonas sedimenti]TWO69508.1 DUF262 domain-containing protein [Caenimonas sedimenti]
MKIEEGKYSIAELLDWYRKKDLVANEEYQRAGRLWPTSAKSYFIDTILKSFPFPKVYFHEKLDKATKRPRREIVDGQQRLNCIFDFVDGKFALGKNAPGYEGQRFAGLPENTQEDFLTYTVSVDVIRNAERADILQMFRRMNAYTLPLNDAEKRHSEYFGEFKDWVNTMLDQFGQLFTDWNILTSRLVVRMADAELITDLALAIEEGIVSTSPAKLKSLYARYESAFPRRDEFTEKLSSTFEAITIGLSEIQGTYAMRTHVFHSLVCALLHNKYGLPGVAEAIDMPPTGSFYTDRESAIYGIKQLAVAHESKDTSQFPDYVAAALEGGNRAAQRTTRIKWLCRALRGEIR